MENVTSICDKKIKFDWNSNINMYILIGTKATKLEDICEERGTTSYLVYFTVQKINWARCLIPLALWAGLDSKLADYLCQMQSKTHKSEIYAAGCYALAANIAHCQMEG